MADIFQEVEEDLRRDRAKKIWDRYGNWILAAAAAIVIVVGGWRAFDYYRQLQAEAVGARLQDALILSRDGKAAEAEAALQAIAAEAPAGPSLLARFRAAAEAGAQDPARGRAAFAALAADNVLPPLLRDLARLREASLAVDNAPYADVVALIEPLAAPAGAWRHSARELLGLSAWRAKDYAAASQWFEAILADPAAPQALRARAEIMLQLISADAPPAAAG